jgi:hypothetical protein
VLAPPEATLPPFAPVPPGIIAPPVWLPAAKDAGVEAPLHPAATPARSKRETTRRLDFRIFDLRVDGIEAQAAPAIGLADD